MRTRMIVSLIAMAAFVSAADAQTAPRKIDITAKTFEFDVSRIEVKAGETVELTLTSADTRHYCGRGHGKMKGQIVVTPQ